MGFQSPRSSHKTPRPSYPKASCLGDGRRRWQWEGRGRRVGLTHRLETSPPMAGVKYCTLTLGTLRGLPKTQCILPSMGILADPFSADVKTKCMILPVRFYSPKTLVLLGPSRLELSPLHPAAWPVRSLPPILAH